MHSCDVHIANNFNCFTVLYTPGFYFIDVLYTMVPTLGIYCSLTFFAITGEPMNPVSQVLHQIYINYWHPLHFAVSYIQPQQYESRTIQKVIL